MAATGIRRKVDDLGRVVIPAGVRRSLGIREGDSLEVSVDGDKVVLSKPVDRCALCGTGDLALHQVGERNMCVQCIDRVAEIHDPLEATTTTAPERDDDGFFSPPWEGRPLTDLVASHHADDQDDESGPMSKSA